MSFMGKISSLMARPNKDLVEKDDVPWWLKIGGRGVGTIGGGIAIFLGILNCTSFITGHIECLIAGVWQMLAGFFVIVVEAPCCCMFIDFVQTFSEWVDKRPYWNRGLSYIIAATPPVFLCFSFSSLIGSSLIFLTGVIYGFMALGKKASASEMRSNAMNDSTLSGTQMSTTTSTNMKASLTQNAQDIARDFGP